MAAPDYEHGIVVICLAALSVIAIVLLILFLLPPILLTRWQRRQKQRENSHGFEVKLNTGMPPVAQRKDNDHG